MGRNNLLTLFGFVESTPALVDIDGDQDLEIFLQQQQHQVVSFMVFIIMVLQCPVFQKSWVQCGQVQQYMI